MAEPEIDQKRPPLTIEGLRSRLLNHTYNSYTNFAFFIKGAIVALAAIAFLRILGTPDESDRLVALSFWLVSFLFGLVTIATWSRGSAFTNSRFNFFDILFPISLGMLEAMLYIVLAADIFLDPNAGISIIPGWYFVFALFAISAAGLVYNRRVTINKNDYENSEQMQNLVEESRGWLLSDMLGAGGTGAVILVVGVLVLLDFPILSGEAIWPHLLIATALSGIAVKILVDATSQYRTLARL